MKNTNEIKSRLIRKDGNDIIIKATIEVYPKGTSPENTFHAIREIRIPSNSVKTEYGYMIDNDQITLELNQAKLDMPEMEVIKFVSWFFEGTESKKIRIDI